MQLVLDDVPISKILTRQAFENAIRVNGALGGSTNAVIHLLAMAGRVGVPLSLDDWDRFGRDVPTLVDRTHEARAHVAELAVRLRGIGPFAFHSAGVDLTIAAVGIWL